jgi:hypothetical protein
VLSAVCSYPNRRYPDKINGKLNPAYGVDNSRAIEELGIQFIPLEQTMKEMAEKLIQLGVVKP